MGRNRRWEKKDLNLTFVSPFVLVILRGLNVIIGGFSLMLQ